MDDIVRRSQELIQDLWGAGYTVVKRQGDPFHVPPDIIPKGMAYQWNDPARVSDGWRPVSAERHQGLFAPYGYSGDIEVGGLVLCERAKSDVDAANAATVAKAHKNVTDWIERNAGAGFSGGVRIGYDGQNPDWQKVGDETFAETITEKAHAG